MLTTAEFATRSNQDEPRTELLASKEGRREPLLRRGLPTDAGLSKTQTMLLPALFVSAACRRLRSEFRQCMPFDVSGKGSSHAACATDMSS